MRAALRGAVVGVLAVGCTYGAGGQGETADPDTGGSTSSTGGPADATYDVCGEPGSSSMLDELGQCWCEVGHTWNNPYDPRDFGCHEIEPREIPCTQACDATAITVAECAADDATHACDCADGYDWCRASGPADATEGGDDPIDTRCCVDPAQPPSDGTGSGTSGTGEGGSDTSGASSESSSDGSSGGSTASGTSEQ